MNEYNSKKEDERKPSGLWTKYKANGIPYGVMITSDFPIEKFIEWIEICKRDFSSVRWAKIWQDHEKAKLFDLLVAGKFSIKPEQNNEKKKESVLLSGEDIE